MEYKTIVFEEAETGIGLATLNRPNRLNAMSLNMLDDLYSLVREIDKRQDIRVLMITGAGKGFCSGADVKDERLRSEEGLKLFSSSAAYLEGLQERYTGLILKMRRLKQPIIAAVNGAAAGGGMCLALASDIIIAGPEASFTPSFINIGLSSGELGSSYFLPRMIGTAKASEVLLTGRTIGAEEADRIGLVSRTVGNGELMDAAMETARVLLSKSPLGIRFTKEAITHNANAPSLEAATELENRNQSICFCAART
ncbi:MAG: enoyl-CoA hydratase/isomerase family protein [Proteobacteria bacterium]|nr:enoyl-CoA hydratase/isomerase family protein [Pseudomonadota bacterium]